MILVAAGAFGLLWLQLTARRRAIGFGHLSRRGALLLAFAAFELLVLAITEVASIDHDYTPAVVATGWTAAVVVLAVTARDPLRTALDRLRTDGGWRSKLQARITLLSVEDRLWLAVLVVIFGILAYLGARYLPSNSDSLLYHLARVEHWIQNQTVAPFATQYLPQVEFAPLSEFNLATLHLLDGTDHLDAAVALGAWVVTVVGVSELARMLGASRSVQVASAVICATIPSGILLATSTENDVFAAAMATVLVMVLLSQSPGPGWLWRVGTLGVVAGLAFLTKATIPVMLTPVAVLLVALALFRQRRELSPVRILRRAVTWVAIAAAGALAVALPFLAQNEAVFGSPLGAGSAGSLSSSPTLASGGANIVRNVANNFHIGNGRSGWEYAVADVSLHALDHVYGLFHVAQDDTRYNVTPSFRAFQVTDYSWDERNEASGANPLQVLLVVVSLGVLVTAVARGATRLRTALVLAVGLCAGYVLFTALFRWGIWNTRYDLLLLALWSPLVAIALSRTTVWVTRGVLVVLVLTCLPQLLDSTTRPVVPSASFASMYHQSPLAPYLIGCCNTRDAEAYTEVAAVLSQSTCRRAAIGNWVQFEYPLWVAMDRAHWSGRLDDVDVRNQTVALEAARPPCAVVTQQGSRYVTPDNGTVNLQVSDLALSLDADRVRTVRQSVPRFDTAADRVRVFPGGGWWLTALGQDPLIHRGSLYVTSPSSQLLHLTLHLPHGVAQPTVRAATGDGSPVGLVAGRDLLRGTVHVHPGVNRFELSATPGPATRRDILVLQSVSVSPASR